ncbi:type II toxin-antitoxin system RelE/ParE family toxin [Xylella fastidiosa]|uniref:Plasmid stabilization protein n=1 Tax=Xylella fastidiosa subsp. sandyi Ann-1 TaxID=155920 RepID=A0A060H8A8_XYLFS|nr:type II toxin-antitoxin system RelE/ParE family toxin [Xylella fastidiosa]AIC11550.1 plasmid stabilization protein [Xylella fastidiosa subsp. sandyi Ann-1]UIX80709.1 type II toxin-antitoxin system RelE/ParE family toxin [Xylella fastidiosa subsp. sandyi]
MPRVIFVPEAIRNIQRLRKFLHPKNGDAAKRAGEIVMRGTRMLGAQPRIGRPVDALPDEYREWLIDFGDSGYVAHYRIDGDTVTILAVRHQKEVGYTR